MNWHWYLNYESELQSVTPQALRAYLESNGWKKVRTYGDTSDVYASETNHVPEIIAPNSQEYSDYTLVLNQIIETLSKCEEREGFAVISDLSLAEYDKIRVCFSDERGGIATSIYKVTTLLHESRMLLRAAARSALRPSPVFDTGNPKKVRDYLRNIQLGQTESGSFVFNLLSPVHSRYNGNAVPFSRRATSMLLSGLQATREVIDGINRNGDDRTFNEAIKKGVSANMCGAVEKMLGGERNECELELSVRWALTREPPTKALFPARFCNSDAPLLRDAYLILKNLPERSSELQGYDGRSEVRVVRQARHERIPR